METQKQRCKRIKYWTSLTKKERKEYQLKVLYGMSYKDYWNLYCDQHGCCAICGKHRSKLNRELCVDPNHKTEKVRGLLCYNCNTFIGKAFENRVTLLRAIRYLGDKK
jgi:hypothetical protein